MLRVTCAVVGSLVLAGITANRYDASAPLPPPDVIDRHRVAVPASTRLSTWDDQSRPVSSLLHVPRKMRYGDYVWRDDEVPPGDVWVRVDLAAQTISIFRAGHEIGTAVILYGADEKPTPTGVFGILSKRKKHRSSLYDAPMPYTLRLTGDGIAIHASDVKWGAATHGCIGVPLAFAERVFAEVSLGDPVVIVPRRPLTGKNTPETPDTI